MSVEGQRGNEMRMKEEGTSIRERDQEKDQQD
jgi:hypothetical protein